MLGVFDIRPFDRVLANQFRIDLGLLRLAVCDEKVGQVVPGALSVSCGISELA